MKNEHGACKLFSKDEEGYSTIKCCYTGSEQAAMMKHNFTIYNMFVLQAGNTHCQKWVTAR